MSGRDKSPIRFRLGAPFLDEDEISALREVLDSGRLVQGPRVEQFESSLSEYTGARYAIAVSSGTAALHVLFQAVELTPGEAVFIPSFAWPSAANVVSLLGGVPILVDVLPDTYNIDPDHLHRRIGDTIEKGWGSPRWVLPIHQFGLPCLLDEIKSIANDFGLGVIEDAACALGAHVGKRHVGTVGKAGVLSFHPRKSITTAEGGAILTDDDDLASRCRALRNHGQRAAFDFIGPGLNYRMSELHAALGGVQMRKLEYSLRRRRELAHVYVQELSDLAGVTLPAAPDDHTWQTFMVRVDGSRRDGIIKVLREDYGIEAGIGSVDAHTLSIYSSHPSWQPLPVSQVLNAEGLALPLHAGLSEDDARTCAKALCEVLSAVPEH